MTEINKEIEKTFTEMDSLMGVLYSQFKDITGMLSKVLEEKKNPSPDLGTHVSSDSLSNDDLLAKISGTIEKLLSSEKDIEIRLNHLFDSSQPALDEKKRLHYSFYELQEILTKIVSGLPGLVDEEGEINQESLISLVSVSEALEKLKNGEEKRAIVRGGAGDENLYEVVKKSEIDELRKKLDSFEAAEKNRNDQLRQVEEKEQQSRDEIGNELASIDYSITSPNELSAEELTEFLTKLKGIKNSLNGTNGEEQVLKKSIRDDEGKKLKQLSVQVKLEKGRLNTKQRIANALADKGETVPEKQVEVKKEELPDYKSESQKERYRNYPLTLDKMDSLVKINEFEREIVQVITKQRQAYRPIIDALSLGKKAIENGSVKKAKKVKESLIGYCNLLRKSGHSRDDGYRIYLKKATDFYVLIGKLESFIKEQERLMAQVEQPSK